METTTSAARIAELNDQLRPSSGKRHITPGVAALSPEKIAELMRKVAEFNSFNEDNDPYSEHDFGCIEMDDQRYFWKIDYYDANMEYGSEDPANPAVTTRVLSLMRADEY